MEREHLKQNEKRNNFNIVRFIAALFVVIGHTGPIIGKQAITIFGLDLHAVGVQVLFFMGGYLVTTSWKREQKIGIFLYKRFLRLWPPYAVMILIMTFVTGPLISELGIRGYFSTGWTDYLKNLRFYIIFCQPGVFTELPLANVTNGSLWTMPVEALLYLLTPILFSLTGGGKSRKSFYSMAALTGICCILNILYYSGSEPQVIWYATDWVKAGKLMVFYMLGMLCSYEEMKPIFQFQRACLVLILLAPLSAISPLIKGVTMQVGIPYFVMSLAITEKPMFSSFGKKYELSYGIYLYGFFFQQLTCSWFQRNGDEPDYLIVLVISLVMTLDAAWLNSICIERPLLGLKRKLVRG